ncbi:MAG: hypothetical protein IKE10_01440 [Bacilli bacterium]|nr:hypothetical protein [Bacilli bacterium]
MSNENIVFEDEIFLKIKPTDYTKEVEKAKKNYPLLKNIVEKEGNRLNNQSHVNVSELGQYVELYNLMKHYEEVSKMSPISTVEMGFIYVLSLANSKLTLKSIRLDPYMPIIMRGFTSMETMLKEYRSLPDIIEKEPFIGKKVVDKLPNSSYGLYVLYELENVLLLAMADEEKGRTIVTSGIKGPEYNRHYIDDGVPGIEEPSKIYSLIYKQRFDGEKLM